MSNNGHPQRQQPPEVRRTAGQPQYLEAGSKIWIGSIPPEFTKLIVMRMLGPCRGLVDITNPKPGHVGPAYVFARYVIHVQSVMGKRMANFISALKIMTVPLRLFNVYLGPNSTAYRPGKI